MNTPVTYKGVGLHKNSKAYELYCNWKSAKNEKDQTFHKKALDAHMKELDQNEKNLLERY